MPPRPRSPRSRGLPDNLTGSIKHGVEYFEYRNPLTGKRTGMGSDRAKAIAATKAANAILAQQLADQGTARLVSRVQQAAGQKPKETIGELIDPFRAALRGRRNKRGAPLSAKTFRPRLPRNDPRLPGGSS